MNNNLKMYSAYYLGVLLERKKIDPIIILEYYLLNFKKANKNIKLSFSKVLEKKAYKEATLSWKRQKKNQRLSFFDGIPIVWKDLVDINTITVQLQPIGAHQDIIVKRWDAEKVELQSKPGIPINCFYHIFAERKDIENLIVEYKGDSIDDYPGDNTIYSINK